MGLESGKGEGSLEYDLHGNISGNIVNMDTKRPGSARVG